MTRNLSLGHAVRRFSVGAGEMKRRSDRLEMWLRLLVLACVLVTVPLAAAVGTAASAELTATAARQTASLSRVDAVLQADAQVAAGTSAAGKVLVDAAWWSPTGVQAGGKVYAPADAVRGDVVPVWLDADGVRQAAPLDAGQVSVQAVSIALVVGGFLLLGIALCHVLTVAALNARRAAQWDLGWEQVGPVWAEQLR